MRTKDKGGAAGAAGSGSLGAAGGAKAPGPGGTASTQAESCWAGGWAGRGRQGLRLLLLALDLGTNCTLKKGIHGLRWEEFQASNRKKKSLSRQNESLLKKARMRRQWESIALCRLVLYPNSKWGLQRGWRYDCHSGCQALGFVLSDTHLEGVRAFHVWFFHISMIFFRNGLPF